ncbi:hypothetical protein [Treponema endosymbiont of Eucomonympha sp.]|uniref:hypothetical protein n=1 Tax=Treponema endosymbiont of Eucomonympha sp. TaxID=1580831 RepID=UPI000A4B51B4|nr:hypothetical protein [Treponema endosymbiont of Eucomonympha sp.]
MAEEQQTGEGTAWAGNAESLGNIIKGAVAASGGTQTADGGGASAGKRHAAGRQPNGAV